MNILGVVAHTMGYGDSCAALSINGEIVGIVEEERLTRKRYDDRFPQNAIAQLLEMANVKGENIDVVSIHIHPHKGIANRIYWALKHPFSTLYNSADYLKTYLQHGNLKEELEDALGTQNFKIEYYGHHRCHAAAAFYSSPFERAAFLTLDGAGEAVTGSYGTVDRTDGIDLLKNFSYPHSLGIAYSAICDYIGFPAPAGPGKVMGLAAYGDSLRFLPLMRRMIQCRGGNLKLDLSYFLYHKNLVTPLSSKDWLSKRFTCAVGFPKRHKSDELGEDHMDLAAAIQERTNEVGVEFAQQLARQTGERNLCIGGGVALNSVMNGIIEEKGIFENMYVQPAVGDAGNTIGSIYLAALRRGQSVPRLRCIPYAGPEYTKEQIEYELINRDLNYRESGKVSVEAAESIRDGQIIGWFQGRMEYGPRALGGRSILADAQHPEMKDIINNRIKHREWFRPFAPSVTQDAYSKYFTGPEINPYMLIVARLKPVWQDTFPSITHYDGTARVQSINREDNARYYELVNHLGKIHDHPVVLNTSFNYQEPIVCTPKDAVECFVKAGMDRLFIGDFIVESANR